MPNIISETTKTWALSAFPMVHMQHEFPNAFFSNRDMRFFSKILEGISEDLCFPAQNAIRQTPTEIWLLKHDNLMLNNYILSYYN